MIQLRVFSGRTALPVDVALVVVVPVVEAASGSTMPFRRVEGKEFLSPSETRRWRTGRERTGTSSVVVSRVVVVVVRMMLSWGWARPGGELGGDGHRTAAFG